MFSRDDVTRFGAVRAVGLGIIYMLVALVGQEIVQSGPAIIFLLYHGFNVSYLITIYPKILAKNYILYSIFMGGVAGSFQEGSTYIAVDTRKKNMAIFIGLGFAIVDIFVLLAQTLLDGETVSKFEMFLISLNVISPLLFHPGTATFMKWGRLVDKGKLTLLLSIIIHAVIDGGLVYSDYYIDFYPALYHITVYEFWAMVMILSAGIFIAGTMLLRRVTDVEINTAPVVY